MVYYTVRFRDAALVVKIKCVHCVNRCGPRSNINFVHFLWTTFVFYVMNYGMIIVPSRAAGDILLYVHNHWAEIEGDDSRACNTCLWSADPRYYYDFGCRKPEECTCNLCCKQPLSLKSAASEIVFRLVFNIEKFRLDSDTTYDQYVYVAQHYVNIPIERLVPFTGFPTTFKMEYIEFDESSLGRIH